MLINQSSLMNTIPTSVANPTDQLLPPVLPRIRERIIKGECTDFTTLLVYIDQMPSRAPSLIVYQCTYHNLCTNNLYPLESWLNYDV